MDFFSHTNALRRSAGWVLAGALMLFPCRSHAIPSTPPVAGGVELLKDIGLDGYITLVLRQNDELQAQVLATEAARRVRSAELGIFEPDWVVSGEFVNNDRPNTIEQERNLGGVPIFQEENFIYDSALESLLPTGMRIRLGYTLRDLKNNLPPTGNTVSDTQNHEYQGFGGLTVTQPLLKNGGIATTMARIRLAGVNSKVSFQEYRRRMMTTVAQAETVYWNLYFAQAQLRFLDESVSVAESLLRDSRAGLEAGKASELDVLEAQSGLALRTSRRNDAMQRYWEAFAQACSLAGIVPREEDPTVGVIGRPECTQVALSFGESERTAFGLNPDYLIQRTRIEELAIRLGVAKNQMLPELNLRGTYGYNGLGDSAASSWDEMSGTRFPSWSVGVEMRIPFLGGIRGRNEYAAAKLNLRQGHVALRGVETRLLNALYAAIKKVRMALSSVKDYETVLRFNENLLKNQLQRFEVGKVDGRRVLEVEADLFEARQSLAEALVTYRRVLLELHLAEGSILDRRRLETTPDELRRSTMALLKSNALGPLGRGSGWVPAPGEATQSPTQR